MFIRTILVYLCLSQISALIRQLESGLSKSQEEIAVQQHNRWRERIARGIITPKASNMLRMKYDTRLGEKAQALTDSHVYRHNTVFDGRWKYVGQNIILTRTSHWVPGPNWTFAIKIWNDEQEYFIYPNSKIKVPGSKIDHYTQLVWANSWAVGCGYTAWYDDSMKYYYKYYACNYGPGGNREGRAPYEYGNGCENLCDPPENRYVVLE